MRKEKRHVNKKKDEKRLKKIDWKEKKTQKEKRRKRKKGR